MTEPIRTRSGTNVRQRQQQVGVRFTDSELAELDALCERYGQSRGEMIRLLISGASLMEARSA